jgi:hypothetical protein
LIDGVRLREKVRNTRSDTRLPIVTRADGFTAASA